MKGLITICARGGSKGIPGKNIKLLDNIPLIHYTINVAKAFSNEFNFDIGISTDDSTIFEIASGCYPFMSYSRPNELATDDAGKIEVIRDLLIYYENKLNKSYDYVLDLDVTSPLRTLEDLKNAFSLLQENTEAINLFSVNRAHRNPYFNMVELKSNGFYNLVCKEVDGFFKTRQSSPRVYDLNASFYFYRRKFFEKKSNTPFTEKSLIYEMEHICFDLDHNDDFEFLEYLIMNSKLDFWP